jgi:DNA-binding PadR family transcriptional regulator
MEGKGWIEAEWRMTDNNRRAKFYALTRSGRRQLEAEKESWDRMTEIIALVMQSP